jgi:2-hydroxy-3-keto-5-methylthiopentenyl-1-phosphate phosphatase
MYLICDFDGTLVKNDFFEERFFKYFLEQPWMIFRYGFHPDRWLQLKHKLLDDYFPEYDLEFIFNRQLMNWIKENSGYYKETLLVSGSPDVFIKKIIGHMAIFDRIHGSSTKNLVGENKLRFIRDSGYLPFTYIGDSVVDLPLFSASCEAYQITVNGIKKLK